MNKAEAKKKLAKYLKWRTKRFNFLGGISFLSTGYVYAPYVPLQVTPVFLADKGLEDEELTLKEARRLIAVMLRRKDYDFTYKKPIVSQYAKKQVNPSFYGTVTIKK